MRAYEHIIWDWNGTLLDDVALCVDVMNSMLRDRNMPEIDENRYRQIFDFPVRAYYEALGFDFVAEPFEHLAATYCSAYDARVSEYALRRDAVPVLRDFAENGVGQSLLSSHEHDSLLSVVEHFGVAHHFRNVMGQSNRYAAGKIEVGRQLMRRISARPGGVVLIGDTTHDHEVASALGIDCILVSNGHHSMQRLRSVHDRIVESLSDLGGWAA